jgi:hypothetical protein
MARPIEHFPDYTPEPLFTCSQCECEIYPFDEYYEYADEKFCSRGCVHDRADEETFSKYAEGGGRW